jgi:hypothetical protein
MPLPITIPNTFANATATIPLSQLDNNFSTVAVAVNSIGNGAFTLANVQVTGGKIANVVLDNVSVDVETLSNVTITNLTVNGNATLTNAAVTANVATITTANTTDVTASNSAVISVNTSGNALRITQVGSGNALLVEDSSNPDSSPFVVDAAGSVGIGTSSPSYPLHVQFSSAVAYSSSDMSAAGITAFLYNSSVTDSTATTLYMGVNGTSTDAAAAISTVYTSASNGALAFGTRGGGNVIERARIDSSGRLLVGLTSTNSAFGGKLQVEGTSDAFASLVRYSSSAASNPAFYFGRSKSATLGTNTIVASGDALGAIVFSGANGTGYSDAASIQGLVDGTPGASADMPGRLVFSTSADGSATPTERMRIDSSGNVLVNRTTGLGSAKFVVEADTTTANPMTVSNSRSSAATDYSILFYRNASLVGSVQTTLSATSYVTSSDYRLKHDIAPITGALARVALLKPCTYKWNADDSNGEGFIAHELQAVVPDAVSGEKDGEEMQGVDYGKLTPILTAALQEAIAKIEALQARIAVLEAK